MPQAGLQREKRYGLLAIHLTASPVPRRRDDEGVSHGLYPEEGPPHISTNGLPCVRRKPEPNRPWQDATVLLTDAKRLSKRVSSNTEIQKHAVGGAKTCERSEEDGWPWLKK